MTFDIPTVFHLDETMGVKQRDGLVHYYPAVVRYCEKGYFRTDWDYGTDFHLAKLAIEQLNTERGFTSEQVEMVVISSMFPYSKVTLEEVTPSR
jgi:hypothetical protein